MCGCSAKPFGILHGIEQNPLPVDKEGSAPYLNTSTNRWHTHTFLTRWLTFIYVYIYIYNQLRSETNSTMSHIFLAAPTVSWYMYLDVIAAGNGDTTATNTGLNDYRVLQNLSKYLYLRLSYLHHYIWEITARNWTFLVYTASNLPVMPVHVVHIR